MITNSTFKPPWWLRNSHVQTCWPKFFRPQPQIETRHERLELTDGDFLDLNFTTGDSGPIILILHGLEGSLESKYAAGILKTLHENNYRGVLMHFRNCSKESNRLARSYHSGETNDILHVIKLLKKRYPNEKLAAIGYSLGGNALLKLLGEQKIAIPLNVAAAISVPFLLNKAADRFNRGFSKLYQQHLLSSLKEKTLLKIQKGIIKNISTETVKQCNDFWTFDNKLTAKLHGFDNVNDYYKKSSSRQYLKNIETPTLIIHDKYDPFMSPDVIPTIEELSEKIELELCEYGGHVGFVTGNVFKPKEYWLEKRLLNYLNDNL